MSGCADYLSLSLYGLLDFLTRPISGVNRRLAVPSADNFDTAMIYGYMQNALSGI